MEIVEGLYLELGPSGEIKSNLVTGSGEVALEPSSVVDEIIEFSEMNFQQYAAGLKELEQLSIKVQGSDALDTYRTADPNVFDELVRAAYSLADRLYKSKPQLGVLTKTLLDSTIRKDDGSAWYIYETKTAIENRLLQIMMLQLMAENVLEDMQQGNDLDFEGEYPDLRQVEAIQILTFEEKITAQYLFRFPINYYLFLLAHFVAVKPNLALCEYCGRYSIPKTKKKTLYCDRVIVDGKTCKDMGPARKHREKAAGNKVIAEYNRARRRMYKRAERAGDRSKAPSEIDIFSKYHAWLDSARAARDAFLRGEITEEAALEIIKREEAVSDTD